LEAKGGEDRKLPKRICDGSGAFILIQNSLTNKNNKEDKFMLRREKGFTLIELLIVIAIIGILAAIAIPMYKTQTIKAKLTEVTNGMSNVASAVAAYMQETGGWPTASTKALIQSSLGVSTGALGRVSLMSVTAGVISATVTTIDATVDNRDLVMRPTSNIDGSITWDWSTSLGMPPAYIPKR
jgi:type IV pilus assembly protein PilA